MIGISRRELSDREGAGRHLVVRERLLPLIFLALGVICGPFLLTILLTVILLLFLYFLGLAGTAVAAAVFWSSAYISYAVLLPLAAMRAIRSREQKQKITNEMITNEMIAFFSTKIVALYSISEVTPAVAEDPRTAEAFTLYSQASQIMETVQNPLNVRNTVERGVYLVDELMADYRTPNCE